MLKITCALCLFLFACGGQASTRPTLRSGTSSANPALAPTSTAQVRAPDAAPQRDIDLSGLIALTEAEAARGVRPAVNGLGADLFARVASTRGWEAAGAETVVMGSISGGWGIRHDSTAAERASLARNTPNRAACESE